MNPLNETNPEQGAPGQDLAVAVLGGGCFWCLEAVFLDLDGVHSVESGYCGGHLVDPDYARVCAGDSGHAEVVRVRFEPRRLDYRTLLKVFFAIHDPCTRDRQGHDVGPQYRSVIFAQDAAQAEIARALIAELEAEQGFPAPIVTELAAAAPFWPAEEVHRDYYRRNPGQTYCQYVVAPKLAHFRARFADLRRGD